eukprot:6481024-Prymnesium_polylepis.1
MVSQVSGIGSAQVWGLGSQVSGPVSGLAGSRVSGLGSRVSGLGSLGSHLLVRSNAGWWS